jgi:cytochrome P450
LSNERYHWWIAGIFNVFKISAFLACIRFFPWLEAIFLKCIPKKMQDLQKAHYQAVVDKTQRRLKAGTERPDIMYYILKVNGPKGMSIPEIESSMNVLSVGGSHNSSSTMSGITNYLVKNPTCLQKLAAEVRGAHKSIDDITFASLIKLPYLNAVIEEGLRIAPPFPAGLPRCVPEGGDTVCGEFLPGGTHVQVNSWALQRVSKAFALANEFHPERWLPNQAPDSPFINDDKAASQQFSVGPRRCLGEALAYAELRLMLGSMVYSFDFKPVDSPAGRLDWELQKTYMVVEEDAFEVRLVPVEH